MPAARSTAIRAVLLKPSLVATTSTPITCFIGRNAELSMQYLMPSGTGRSEMLPGILLSTATMRHQPPVDWWLGPGPLWWS